MLISLFVISPYKLFSKNIDLIYEVEWKTVNIASLIWSAKIDNSSYRIDNQIISDGIFSKMYPFELKSSTLGLIEDNLFFPKSFNFFSQTKKKNKNVQIKFNKKGFIEQYKISPPPEDIYLDNFEILKLNKSFIDPVSQLFQYFLFQTSSNRTIIDGRRIYDLKAEPIDGKKFNNLESTHFEGETLGLKITFPYYLSLWKSSKEDTNLMEYIQIYYNQFENTNIPIQIVIKTKRVKVFLNLSSYNIIN
ncbi:DUF3108 domain-containing protein [Alphaproteobacteria bacterium]|nr:DUF3108 domain-containing protein [Alphaproteobacteria bacterium]